MVIIVTTFIAARYIRKRVKQRRMRKRVGLILDITRWLTAGPAGDSQALKQAPLDYTDIDPVDVTNDRTLPDVLVIAASDVTLEPDPTPNLADPSEDSLHPTIPECMCETLF
jgi:hypothetical protein